LDCVEIDGDLEQPGNELDDALQLPGPWGLAGVQRRFLAVVSDIQFRTVLDQHLRQFDSTEERG
jgi:hypothetical protein